MEIYYDTANQLVQRLGGALPITATTKRPAPR
jgi:hypothetical protein